MSYTITIIRKNIKNTYLRVKPPNHLVITCNKRVSTKELDAFIGTKQRWINKQNFLSNLKTEIDPPLYNGAIVRLTEKEYVLHFKVSTHNIVMSGLNDLWVSTRDINDDDLKHKLLIKWYTDQFQHYVFKRTTELYQLHSNKEIQMPTRINVKNMSSRWGSFSKKTDTLSLATRLGAYSTEVIDSVICHELAHTRFMHHQKDFHTLLLSMMPTYQKAHRALKINNIHANWFLHKSGK